MIMPLDWSFPIQGLFYFCWGKTLSRNASTILGNHSGGVRVPLSQASIVGLGIPVTSDICFCVSPYLFLISVIVIDCSFPPSGRWVSHKSSYATSACLFWKALVKWYRQVLNSGPFSPRRLTSTLFISSAFCSCV